MNSTKRPYSTHGVTVALAAFAAVCVSTAHGTMITADIKDGTRDTGWQMVYDDSQVQFLSFTGIATGRIQGTLSITKVFSNLDSISITFKEIAPAATDNFGLRINIDEEVTNLSGVDWSGFRFDLVDNTPLSPQGDPADHPAFAHFHTPTASYTPFVKTGGEDRANFITLGNGIFADGTTSLWSGIKLHQYEDMGAQRDFTMVETPFAVPEHASIAVDLLGLGLLVAIRRRWMAQDSRPIESKY